MIRLTAENAVEAPLSDGQLQVAASPSQFDLRRLLVSASATGVLQVVSLVLGFATAVLLARFLGAEGYGRYVVALTWANLLMIPAILGLNVFLVRGIAVYQVKEMWSLMKGLLFSHQPTGAAHLNDDRAMWCDRRCDLAVAGS